MPNNIDNANNTNPNLNYEWVDGEAWRNVEVLERDVPVAAQSWRELGTEDADKYYFNVCYEELCAYPHDGVGQAWVWDAWKNTWEPLGGEGGATWDEILDYESAAPIHE